MSTDGQGTKWRRNIAENFNRLSSVHERHRRQTDRQTTEGRSTTYSERKLTAKAELVKDTYMTEILFLTYLVTFLLT